MTALIIYEVWWVHDRTSTEERISARTSWDARKDFAARHPEAAVHECVARRTDPPASLNQYK